MKRLASLVFILVLALAGAASGELYRYTDSAGELHFVDDIGKVPKKYRKQAVDADAQGNVNFTAAPDSPPVRENDVRKPARQEGAAAAGGIVEVFMTSWCGYCRKTVKFLTEKGIPFTAYDIEKDKAAAETYRSLGGGGVPVVRIGSKVIHGYSPEAIMHYYNGDQ